MPTGMPDRTYPTDQLDVLRHEFGFVAFVEMGGKSYGIARRALDEATKLRDERDQARAELAELRGELGVIDAEWGVRTRDDDPDEDIEVVSSEAIAREFAMTWRSEIPDANPTAMVRTLCNPGPWRVADGDPHTALERAAAEQGVRPVGDIGEFVAGPDGPTDAEFAAFDKARQKEQP